MECPLRYQHLDCGERGDKDADRAGLGYLLAGSLDAATEFLKNVTGLLLSFGTLSAVALYALYGRGEEHALDR